MEDNQAAIKIAKNPQDHKRTKHIQVKYHYVRDQIRDGVFMLQYVPTSDQLADLFTKGLSGPRLRDVIKRLGLCRSSRMDLNTEFGDRGRIEVNHGDPTWRKSWKLSWKLCRHH